MGTLAETMSGLVDLLTQAGIRATLDPRDLNPPAVLVLPPVLRWTFGGRVAVDYRLAVVVPSSGRVPELTTLGDLMDHISAVLGGAPVTAVPTEYPDGGGGDPLPAYELTWTAKSAAPTTAAAAHR